MRRASFHSYFQALLCLAGLLLIPGSTGRPADDFTRLQHLLRLAEKNPEVAKPKDHIYFTNDIVFCTGESDLATANNTAARHMEAGDFSTAAEVLLRAIRNASLFFPFRYNLGTCYSHLNDLRKALLNFKKAQAVVPEYYGTYIQIGSIYQRWYRVNDAIENYREALRWNRNELKTYVLIGDLFFDRNQAQLAKKYYDQSLRINHRFNNGLLGRAKIHFKEGEYYKALVVLKSINTSDDYDRSYHFYYAESSFKLQDYKAASEHYARLLENRNDRFFLTNSVSLIEHKLNLSNRFIEK